MTATITVRFGCLLASSSRSARRTAMPVTRSDERSRSCQSRGASVSGALVVGGVVAGGRAGVGFAAAGAGAGVGVGASVVVRAEAHAARKASPKKRRDFITCSCRSDLNAARRAARRAYDKVVQRAGRSRGTLGKPQVC